MLCGWKGNRRSGVAPAMRHRLRDLSTYGLNGLCVGDEPLCGRPTPSGHGTFTYLTVSTLCHFRGVASSCALLQTMEEEEEEAKVYDVVNLLSSLIV